MDVYSARCWLHCQPIWHRVAVLAFKIIFFFPALQITLTPPETPPQNQTLINTLDSNMVMIILKYEFDVFLVTG